MTSGNNILFYSAGIATCIIILLFAWVSFDEWYTVKVEAEKPIVDSYYFGEESTINNKGWHYASADLYARMNFIQGLSLILVFLIAGFSTLKRSYLWLAFSICLLFGCFFFWRWYLS